MVQLNLYQFVHGYSTGVCTQMIKLILGIRLCHVPNVQGYVSPCGRGGGVGGPHPKKFRNMKCSRGDSRPT